MSDEDVKTLKEWALSTFVQKDACVNQHAKTDEKINTIMMDQVKANTKLTIIQWLGGIAAGAGIANIISKIHEVIFEH